MKFPADAESPGYLPMKTYRPPKLQFHEAGVFALVSLNAYGERGGPELTFEEKRKQSMTENRILSVIYQNAKVMNPW